MFFQICFSISGTLGLVLLCRAWELEERAVPNNRAEGHCLGCTLYTQAALQRGGGMQQGWLLVAELLNNACRNAIVFINLFGGGGKPLIWAAVLGKRKKMRFASDMSV